MFTPIKNFGGGPTFPSFPHRNNDSNRFFPLRHWLFQEGVSQHFKLALSMVVGLLAATPVVGMLSLLNLCLLLLLLLTLYQTLNLMGKPHSGGLSGKVFVTCCHSRVAVPNCSCAFRDTKFMKPSLISACGAYRII